MAKKTTHRICQHTSGAIKMQRAYIRGQHGFIPCGWLCPDCHQFVNDEIQQSFKS